MTQEQLFELELPLDVGVSQEVWKLEDFDDIKIEGQIHARDVLNSIRNNGILQPIIVGTVLSGLTGEETWVLDGNRRVLDTHWILDNDPPTDETRLDNLLNHIVVLHYSGISREQALSLRSLFNAMRSDNPITDMTTVVALAQKYSPRQISKLTGLKSAKVKAIMGLASLDSEFIEGALEGRIAIGTLHAIRKLSKPYQNIALQTYKELPADKRLTATHINEVKRVQSTEVLKTMDLGKAFQSPVQVREYFVIANVESGEIASPQTVYKSMGAAEEARAQIPYSEYQIYRLVKVS